MSQYQSIQKTVEALQWTGENEKELQAFIGEVTKFHVMPDKTIMVTEKNGNVDFLIKDHYVIKKGETFASSNKENFEQDYELKQEDLFFDKLPIVVLKGLAYEIEGRSEYWAVQVPVNYQDFVCGWLSATKLIDVAEIINLDFLNLNALDEGKTEYPSFNHANNLAQYVKTYFEPEYDCEIVIFA